MDVTRNTGSETTQNNLPPTYASLTYLPTSIPSTAVNNIIDTEPQYSVNPILFHGHLHKSHLRENQFSSMNINSNQQYRPQPVLYFNSNQTNYPPAMYETTENKAGCSNMIPPHEPPSHISFSVFVMLCCCWPMGCIAFAKALKVKKLYEQGKFVASESASESAKTFSIIGLIFGIILIVTIIIVNIFRFKNTTSY